MDKNIKNTTDEIISNVTKKLSNEVTYKLNKARKAALSTEKKQPMFFSAWVIPATAVIALTVYFVLPIIQKDIILPTDFEDMAVIQDMEVAEQIELMDDLEFYQWLSQDDNLSSI